MGMDQYAYMTNAKVSRRMFAKAMSNITCFGRNDDDDNSAWIDEVWIGRKNYEIHDAIAMLHRKKYDEDFESCAYTQLEKSDIDFLDSVIEIDYEEEQYEDLVKQIRIADRNGYKLFYGADW